jgi:hypothetical protein
MRNRLLLHGSLFAAGLLLVSLPPASAQQAAAQKSKPAPRLPDGKPDLSGVWSRRGTPSRWFAEHYAVEAMRPAAREKYKDQVAAGTIRTIRRDLYDPYIRACAPVGISRLITEGGGRGRPFEIFNVPNRLFFHYEWGSMPRTVWMDGRSHPDFNITPTTYMGHSTGRWDGDTLVVDTVGFNDLTWIDTYGTPHSESLHMIERYRRVNLDTMEIQITFEDPEIYAKPLVGNTMTLARIPDGEIQEWVNCDDRIRAMNETDVCKITGAWEYEAYCNRREKGLPMDDLFNNRGGPDGYRGPEERAE